MIFFGKTDIGLKRSSNQDSFSCKHLSENTSLCVVCDGMGGAAGGDVASSIAIQTFCGYINRAFEQHKIINAHKIKSILNAAAESANSAVYSAAKNNPELRGMGTTLCAALAIDDTLHIANIGDSRLYIVSEEKITKITHDHSYVQYLIDIGNMTPEEAADCPHRNIVTRIVGSEDYCELDYYTVKLSGSGEYVLICSDGLTNYMAIDDIRSIVTSNIPFLPGEELTEDEILEIKTGLLIEGANQGGGGDNITVILMQP